MLQIFLLLFPSFSVLPIFVLSPPSVSVSLSLSLSLTHTLPDVNLKLSEIMEALVHVSFNIYAILVLPWWLSGKESACNAGNASSSSGSRRSPGEWNGNPLQYSCLENPIDGGAWWTTVHAVAKESELLSDWLNNTWDIETFS